MGTLTSLQALQWGGPEGTKGSAATVTERALFDEITLQPIDEMHQPNAARSWSIANADDAIPHMRGVDWSGSTNLQFEQWHTIAAMSIEGGTSAVGSGLSRTWTHDRPITTVPPVDSLTIEGRNTDGTNPFDQQLLYSILRSWELSWGQTGAVDLSVDGFARKRDDTITLTALTGVDAQPVTERVVAPRVAVYIDDTSSFGSSQVVCKALAGSLTFNTGHAPLMTNDNRTSLDFCTDIYNPESAGFELSLTLLMLNDGSAVGDYGTESANAQAGTQRYVRIFLEGGVITGGTRSSIALDMTARHQNAEIPAPTSQDGQDIVEYTFVPKIDGTTPWFASTTVNARDAICDGTPAA